MARLMFYSLSKLLELVEPFSIIKYLMYTPMYVKSNDNTF